MQPAAGHGINSFMATHSPPPTALTPSWHQRGKPVITSKSLLGVSLTVTALYLGGGADGAAAHPACVMTPHARCKSLPVYGVLAPDRRIAFELTERNNLLYSGISTFTPWVMTMDGDD